MWLHGQTAALLWLSAISAGKEAEAMTHQPKGGMCATCAHARRNCSHLPFSTMPPLSRDGQTVIVRCTEFQRRAQQ